MPQVELSDELTRLGVAKTADVSTALATKATASQGAKADTAVQPAALTSALSLKADTTALTSGLALKANAEDVTTSLANKVDKDGSKVLSDNNYTTAEQTLVANAVQPAALAAGLSSKVETSTYTAGLAAKANTSDVTTQLAAKADNSALTSGLATKADTSALTAGLALKVDTTTYTSGLAGKVNVDGAKVLSTNDYTNAEKTKLAGVANGATANSSDATLLSRTNHTGLAPAFSLTGLGSGLKFAAHGTSIMTSRKAVMPFTGNIAVAPKGAWGLVKMVAAYTGPCCRVLSPYDSTEYDIPFAQDGIVDSNYMNTVRSQTQYLYITKLYDQTATDFTTNGNHAVQTTASLQPYIDMEYMRNGMPAIVTGGRYLNIPSSHVIASNQACAVFTAVGNWNSRVNSTLFCLGATGTFELSLSPGTSFSVQPKINGTALSMPTTASMQTLPGSNGVVVGLNSSAAAMSYTRNQDLFTRTAATLTTNLAGGTIGTPGAQLVDLYGMITYDTNLTTNQINTIQFAMSRAYTSVLRARANVVIVGDSIVAGTAELGHTYNKALWHHFGNNLDIKCIGLGGQKMQDMATDVTNRAVPLFRNGMVNVGILMGGTNDITLGRTLAEMQADATTWCTAMKAAGFITVMQTLYPRPLGATGAGTVTQAMFDQRIAFNDWIRANSGPGKALADYYIDVQWEPTIATAPINTTDWPDGQHPVNSGYVKIAAVQAPVIYTILPALVQS